MPPMATRDPRLTDSSPAPKTQGERIRYARVACGLSQGQLAKAVSLITKNSVTKSQVSQWERDSIKNPTNANMLGIQAATGFSMRWLVSGRGDPKATMEPVTAVGTIDRDRLQRAITGVLPTLPGIEEKAQRIAAWYEVLGDAKDLSDPVINRIVDTMIG